MMVRMLDSLSGSGVAAHNCSHLLAVTNCADISNFVPLHLLKNQLGLKGSHGHSQGEGVSPIFFFFFFF